MKINKSMKSTMSLAAGLALVTSAHAAITLDNTGTVSGVTTLAGFDATASDKLVVLVGGPANSGGGWTGTEVISGVTYNGISLIEAVQVQITGRVAGVFYLDSADFAGTGDIVVTYAEAMHAANGISAMALSGTAAGVGPTNGNPGATATIAITENGTFVAAASSYNGTPQSPLTSLNSGDFARAYEENVSAGSYTATFSAGQATVAAGFTAAVPEPSTTALLGLGGLALILRRRK